MSKSNKGHNKGNNRGNRIIMSTATNAYDLLDDVVQAIRMEPKRLVLQVWTNLAAWSEKTRERNNAPRFKYSPLCGIIGCIAGWMVILHDGKAAAQHPTRIYKRAVELLGVPGGGYLFNSSLGKSAPQTRKHVEEAVDRIRKFQGKHEQELRAHDIRDSCQ